MFLILFLSWGFGNGVSAEDLGPNNNPEEVTLQLKWFHQFQFAGYYMAIEKRFYKKAGLKVILKPGGPDVKVDDEVLSGRAQFGVLASELIQKRVQGKKLVLLAVIFQHSVRTLIVRDDSEIYSPADLAGQTIMLNSNEQEEFLAMLINEGVSPEKINIIPKDSEAIKKLIKREVSAINGSIANQPYFFSKNGIGVRLLRPIVYGVDFYGDSIFTSEDELQENPERVAAFREASLKGWEYALANIGETIHIIQKKYNKNKTQEQLQFEAQKIKQLILPDLVELGHLNPHRIEKIAEIYKKDLIIPTNYSLEGFIYDSVKKTSFRWIKNALYLLIAAGVLIAVTLVLLFFNYQLKKTVSKRTQDLLSANELLKKEISERKQTEKALLQSEEKYRELVESTNSIIMKFDTDFTITFVNQHAQNFFGYTEEEMIGKNAIGTYIPAIDKDGNNMEELTKKIIRDPQAYINNENENMTKNGDRLWVAWRNKGIYDDKGKLIEMLSMGYDITKRKKAEETLQKTLDELEKKVEIRTHELQIAKEAAEVANVSKSEFLANISHELRNPMHQILSYSKYGIEKIDKPKEKLLHYFNQARKAAERLMVLLNDLLDLSKMESGKIEYKLEETNIYHVIIEAVGEFGPTITEKNINLEVSDPLIPTKIVCDYYKVGQVIRNLLINAIKFTPENNSIKISIEQNELEYEYETVPALQVSVCDQGVGIPEKEIFSIFDKFTQSSKTKTGAGGTGLGLAICSEIIKAHKGKIWAKNNPEKGATLSFMLPY